MANIYENISILAALSSLMNEKSGGDKINTYICHILPPF